jgi:hypothetical protein
VAILGYFGRGCLLAGARSPVVPPNERMPREKEKREFNSYEVDEYF